MSTHLQAYALIGTHTVRHMRIFKPSLFLLNPLYQLLYCKVNILIHYATIVMGLWAMGLCYCAAQIKSTVQYVGKSRAFNKVQRQVRLEQVVMGNLASRFPPPGWSVVPSQWSCAHLVDRPLPIICPKGWVFPHRLRL